MQKQRVGHGQQDQIQLLQGVVSGEEEGGQKEEQRSPGTGPQGARQTGEDPAKPQGKHIGRPIAAHRGPKAEAVLQQAQIQKACAQQHKRKRDHVVIPFFK